MTTGTPQHQPNLDRSPTPDRVIILFDHQYSGERLEAESWVDYFKVSKPTDVYTHFICPADGDNIKGADLLLEIGRQAHAEGYYGGKLVKPPAIQEGNRLIPDVDKSRGNPGLLFLAVDPKNGGNRVTAKVMDSRIVDGETGFRTLPTFPFCASGITPEAKAAMAQHEQDGGVWRELSALTRTGSGTQIAMLEMFRNIYRQTAGRGVKLYCSMVRPVYDHLQTTFLPQNLRIIGDSTFLLETDFRPETELVPVIIEPDEFIGRLVDGYHAEANPAKKEQYRQTALFMIQDVESQLVPGSIATLPLSPPQATIAGKAALAG